MADGDLLTPIVPDDRQHNSFKSLVGEPRHAPACDLLRQVWAAFPNPDDHFIREFQTHGFDARVWELVLFCIGHRAVGHRRILGVPASRGVNG
jgi:hypothetical protein